MAGKRLSVDLRRSEAALRPRMQDALRTTTAMWSDAEVAQGLNMLIAGEIDASMFLANVYSKITSVDPVSLTNELSRLQGKGMQDVFEWITKAPDMEAARWSNAFAAERVDGIRASSMRSIRSYVTTAVETPGAIEGLRGNISKVLMMDERWARATAAQFRRIERAKGVTEGARSMKKRTDAYVERVARQRGKMIARTEVITALNNGRAAGFQVAMNAGLLEPGTEQVWIVASDEKMCVSCGELDGVKVPIGHPWVLSNGTQIYHPTLHPNCRCTIGVA